MLGIDARPTLEEPDDDPYLWLEDIESPRVLDWVEAQNAEILQRFNDAGVIADRDVLKAIYDRPDNIPYPDRRSGKLFNLWQDAAHPRGMWRTTTLESFASDAPDWDVLIDVDALATKDGEDWVWRGGVTLPPAHERAIAYLSRGGADATVLREFDLTTRKFVADGFNVPEGRNNIDWLDRDTLLISSSLGAGMSTRIGGPRTVRLWRRGTDLLAAPVIFDTNGLGAWTSVDRTVAHERVLFVEQSSFLDSIFWIGDHAGPKTRLDVPTDAWAEVNRDFIAVKPHTPWTIGGEAYAPGTVVGMSFTAFLTGDRRFTRLFEPGERRALQGFFWCGGRLVLSILDDLKPVFEVLTPAGGGWARARITGLPDLGTAHVWSFDACPEESNGDLLALAHDQVTPPSLFLIQPARPQTRPARFRPGRARHHSARSDLKRRHAHPLCAGRPAGRNRRGAGPSHGLWRLRHLDDGRLRLHHRQAVARTGRHVRHRPSARRVRIRRTVARGGTPRRKAAFAR